MVMKRQRSRLRISPRARKLLLISGLSLVALFIVGNAVLWAMYRNRTYPGTRVVQTSIGSVAYSRLAQTIDEKDILPENLTIVHGQQKVNIKLTDLDIRKDITPSIRSAGEQRSWLPIVNLFKKPVLRAPVSIGTDPSPKIAEIGKQLRADAADARLNLNGTAVQIIEAKDGFELDGGKLWQAILPALDKGKTTIQAPVQTTKAKVRAADLKPQQQELEAQFKTPITLKYGGKSKQATAAEVAGWYVPASQTYTADGTKIQNYIAGVGAGFGIKVKDVAGVAASVQQALSKKQAANLTLTQQVALKTFTYCVTAKGVDASYLPALRSKLKDTYGSSRGWSVGGLVEFREVASGCNFTVWLTAASLMPTFGACLLYTSPSPRD